MFELIMLNWSTNIEIDHNKEYTRDMVSQYPNLVTWCLWLPAGVFAAPAPCLPVASMCCGCAVHDAVSGSVLGLPARRSCTARTLQHCSRVHGSALAPLAPCSIASCSPTVYIVQVHTVSCSSNTCVLECSLLVTISVRYPRFLLS